MGLFSKKPLGFFAPRTPGLLAALMAHCESLLASLDYTPDGVPIIDEEIRQRVLLAYRRVVEEATGNPLPDDPAQRTIALEEIVANMRLVRLTQLDRAVLVAIGNLLIDAGVRKGRPLHEVIPPNELEALKGKALLYQRYTSGRL